MSGDFHMHTRFSDGSGTVDDMARAALKRGLTEIAITDHMPLPFINRYAIDAGQLMRYRQEIEEVRQKYSGRLRVNLGLEIEYIAEFRPWIESLVRQGWDYLLVSIHHLPGRERLHLVNGTAGEFAPLLEDFDNDGRALCHRYYGTLQEAISTGWFDTVGHLDVLKKHNRDFTFFDETSFWYRSLVSETLEIISRQGVKIEINTAGLGHPPREQYPGSMILREAAAKNIEFVLSSDSHSADTLGQYFDKFSALMHNQR
ncbi:histidinol-phosphatase HisJ [Desulfopila inferna]|uniref:histidinol-phosphatase HisJ n=1 Tax=Desulfopila inferna TaxID=468528 RepID=UPI0019659B23|nr:histidinol-phosphatase HisJ [Desulfopila inferna]MBM9603638.1 histidinol-phosphatase HisJ [Desulfopila inferna]